MKRPQEYFSHCTLDRAPDDADFGNPIAAGINLIHINTELGVAIAG